jgi:hypothetical protein
MFDDLETIYIVFESFKTNKEKVEYLEKLRDRNLDYDINYDKLIEIYSK